MFSVSRRIALATYGSRQHLPSRIATPLARLLSTSEAGENATRIENVTYPSFRRAEDAMSIGKFRDAFDGSLGSGERIDDSMYTLYGRLISKREASQKLVFYDLEAEGHRVQVMASKKSWNSDVEFSQFHHGTSRRGDIVAVHGFPAKTKVGELSLVPLSMSVLTPCMKTIESELSDHDLRFRNRSLDMLINPHVKSNIETRSKIIKYIRTFFENRGFVEVETPILSTKAGGAIARPFETSSNALDMNLYLRIAPELYLKQLVIGGMHKVFEIGKQFRNEGIDATHQPEFTSCEAYEAFASYEDAMDMSEELLCGMVENICGTKKISVSVGSHDPVDVEFTAPFRRISVVPELEKCIGKSLPDLGDEENSVPILRDICAAHGVELKPPYTLARILDEMVGHFIEPQCINPTFVCDHPTILSPLAKEHHSNPALTERFELYMAGKEVCNAYSELNDPTEQRSRFQKQQEYSAAGDDEHATGPDEEFCDALEYALPPTAGWGLGVDRLVMFLTSASNIREVLTFPIVKPNREQ